MGNGLGGTGAIAALGAAALWAIATVLFGRLGKDLPPLVLNLVKGVVALGLIGVTLVLRGWENPVISGPGIGLLLLSGVVGIGLGDTAYFQAVNRLGPRRALLLESLSPPLAALLAWVSLGEGLGAIAWGGIFLTVGGVAWVIAEGTPSGGGREASPWAGVPWGVAAALGQATGSVLSRAALVGTAVDPLWSSLLRLGAGAIVLVGLLGSRGELGQPVQVLRSPRLLGIVAITACLGTYLAIWLQQIAFKYAPTGIAQSLLATSPLFILPIAALLGEKITLRAVVGVLVAIAGISLLLR